MRFGFREEKAFGRGILRLKNPSEEGGRRCPTQGKRFSVTGLEREGLREVRELKKEKKGIKKIKVALYRLDQTVSFLQIEDPRVFSILDPDSRLRTH